jgi:hypothetical protein
LTAAVIATTGAGPEATFGKFSAVPFRGDKPLLKFCAPDMDVVILFVFLKATILLKVKVKKCLNPFQTVRMENTRLLIQTETRSAHSVNSLSSTQNALAK